MRRFVAASLLCWALALGAELLLPSCAHAPDPLITSGQSLHLAADSFVATARLMDTLRAGHVVSEVQFDAWLQFARRFQRAYPLAVDAWTLAVKTSNALATSAAQVDIEGLAAELAVWATRAALLLAGAADGGVRP